MEIFSGFFLYLGLALGMIFIASAALTGIGWCIRETLDRIKRRREIDALKVVVAECHQIERYCSPHQPTAVATARRIRAHAHGQLTGQWPDDVRVTEIGSWRSDLPERVEISNS